MNQGKYYIVWNSKKTEGFVTLDKQLAYEVRKSANTNCHISSGERSELAIKFYELWGEEDCSLHEFSDFDTGELPVECDPTVAHAIEHLEQVAEDDGPTGDLDQQIHNVAIALGCLHAVYQKMLADEPEESLPRVDNGWAQTQNVLRQIQRAAAPNLCGDHTHQYERQFDEYYCHKCNKRWTFEEEPPECTQW